MKRGHPRWADFSRHRAAIETAIAKVGPRLLSASHIGGRLDGLGIGAGTAGDSDSAPAIGAAVQGGPNALPELLDGCILELHEADFTAGGEIVDSLLPLLRPGAPVFVVAYNPRWWEIAGFGNTLNAKAPLFWRSGLWPEDMLIVSAGRLRWWLNGACIHTAGALLQGAVLLMPLRAMLACVLACSRSVPIWSVPCGNPGPSIMVSFRAFRLAPCIAQ